jgi:urea transport system substrate-binding protein
MPWPLAASSTTRFPVPARLLGQAPPFAGLGQAAHPSKPQAWQRKAEFRVALLAPLSGLEGIWGPSCWASARLAQAELNRESGIGGRRCELELIDASDGSHEVEARLAGLLASGEVDAVVGMCISTVRKRVLQVTQGQLPFVYTCLYEGGDNSRGLHAIGETAARQLEPTIRWLSTHRRSRRWVLVGNDYVWPRASHRIARRCIDAAGGRVVGEHFVPLGVTDLDEVIDNLRASDADAVLVSMVGQDAVDFNRAFGAAGLSRRMVRLSCAIEENQLLAIGAADTHELYVALGYFEALQTQANLAFKERYHAHFGARAPTLNSMGQSLYEGVHHLAGLAHASHARPGSPGVALPSARRADDAVHGSSVLPIYLAQADGHRFEVIQRF